MIIFHWLIIFLFFRLSFFSMLQNEASMFDDAPLKNPKALNTNINSSKSEFFMKSRLLQSSSLGLKIVRTYSGNDPRVNMGMTAIGNGPFMIFYVDITASGQKNLYMNFYDSNNFSLVSQLSKTIQNYNSGNPVFTPNNFYFYLSKVVPDNSYDRYNILYSNYYGNPTWSNYFGYFIMNDPNWHYLYITSSPAITHLLLF